MIISRATDALRVSPAGSTVDAPPCARPSREEPARRSAGEIPRLHTTVSRPNRLPPLEREVRRESLRDEVEARRYFQQHGIKEVLDRVVQRTFVSRPRTPLRFMQQEIATMQTERERSSAVGARECKDEGHAAYDGAHILRLRVERESPDGEKNVQTMCRIVAEGGKMMLAAAKTAGHDLVNAVWGSCERPTVAKEDQVNSNPTAASQSERAVDTFLGAHQVTAVITRLILQTAPESKVALAAHNDPEGTRLAANLMELPEVKRAMSRWILGKVTPSSRLGRAVATADSDDGVALKEALSGIAEFLSILCDEQGMLEVVAGQGKQSAAVGQAVHQPRHDETLSKTIPSHDRILELKFESSAASHFKYCDWLPEVCHPATLHVCLHILRVIHTCTITLILGTL